MLTGHDGAVVAVAYSPQGDLLASASKDATVRLWDVRLGACLKTDRSHRDVNDVVYSHNATNLLLTVRTIQFDYGPSRVALAIPS